MATEVSSEKDWVSPENDPVLLGVALPISATIIAATQVRDVWVQALSQILDAAKAKASEKRAEISKKPNGAVKSADPSEITA